MVRIGAFVFMALALVLLLGCGEKATTTQDMGLEVTFPHCLPFNAEVWIDDNYIGSFTSQRASLIDVAAGSHSIYAQSNLHVQDPDSFFCWTENFSIADGKITYLVLDCYGHGCR
jgi:hypothetical protein